MQELYLIREGLTHQRRIEERSRPTIVKIMYALLRYLPRNLLSALFGRLTRFRFPRPITTAVIRAFASYYKVNLTECDRGIEEYSSLSEFFVRPLREGVRTIEDGAVSPVDGVVVEYGAIEGERILQVKGRTYSVRELLTPAIPSERFENGFFVTIYLAPHNYHRIHAPASGEVHQAVVVPGTLWPVNSWSVNNIQDLFAVNERVITRLVTPHGEIGVVAVGAFNVGSISLSFDGELRSNSGSRTLVQKRYSPPHPLNKGDHLATFHLGSTVVLLFERDSNFTHNLNRGEIRVGQRIGDFALSTRSAQSS